MLVLCAVWVLIWVPSGACFPSCHALVSHSVSTPFLYIAVDHPPRAMLQAMAFLNDGAQYEGLVKRWNNRKVGMAFDRPTASWG